MNRMLLGRRRALLLALLALAAPLPALATSDQALEPMTAARGPVPLAVSTSLDSCGVLESQIICKLDVSYNALPNATGYSATVTRADGSVVDYGGVAPGGTSLWVPYVGAGGYSVRITAYGEPERPEGDKPVISTEVSRAKAEVEGAESESKTEVEARGADLADAGRRARRGRRGRRRHGRGHRRGRGDPDLHRDAGTAGADRAGAAAPRTAPGPRSREPRRGWRRDRRRAGAPRLRDRRRRAAGRRGASPRCPRRSTADAEPARLHPATIRPMATATAAGPVRRRARVPRRRAEEAADRRRAGRGRRRAHLRDDRPGDRRADRRRRPRRPRGRRPRGRRRRARRFDGAAAQGLAVEARRADLLARRADQGQRRRARRARVARQRQAAGRREGRHRAPRSPTCATTRAGRRRSRARRSRSPPATCSATRCASRSASAPRSCPGTSRC